MGVKDMTTLVETHGEVYPLIQTGKLYMFQLVTLEDFMKEPVDQETINILTLL